VIHIFAVTLVDNTFTLQHSSGLVSLRPFLLDLGLPVILLLGFVISHGFSYSRGATMRPPVNQKQVVVQLLP